MINKDGIYTVGTWYLQQKMKTVFSLGDLWYPRELLETCFYAVFLYQIYVIPSESIPNTQSIHMLGGGARWVIHLTMLFRNTIFLICKDNRTRVM